MADSRFTCGVQIVRYFDHPEGQVDPMTPVEIDGRTLTKLPGQHFMLSWDLPEDFISFAARTGIWVNLDEYEFPLSGESPESIAERPSRE